MIVDNEVLLRRDQRGWSFPGHRTYRKQEAGLNRVDSIFIPKRQLEMRKILSILLLVLLTISAAEMLSYAKPKKTAPPRRAQVPKFNEATTGGIFFNNVAKEALSGSRPADLEKTKNALATSGSNGEASGASAGWSKIISRETIEDEIKALKLGIDRAVTTPTDFAGRGYQLARRDFSIVAAMFAIAGQYDADVRWKKEAPGIRDVMARAAANAKSGGNSLVYKEAKMRKADLQDLVGGGTFQASGNSPRDPEWPKVCDRAPLMKRLEIAQQDKLQPWMASEKEFKANLDKVVHEAQIIAALTEVLLQADMEDSDDDDYAAFAKKMKQAAIDIFQAVELDNYDQARKAIGTMTKTCDACHEDYRS